MIMIMSRRSGQSRAAAEWLLPRIDLDVQNTFQIFRSLPGLPDNDTAHIN